jgi:hypothetical protein
MIDYTATFAMPGHEGVYVELRISVAGRGSHRDTKQRADAAAQALGEKLGLDYCSIVPVD